MNLTDSDMIALTNLHGGTTEYQEAQLKLFATGHRWCPACLSVLPLDSFAVVRAMALGRASRCRSCESAKRRRSFVKLSDATRRARFFKRKPGKRPKPTRGPYSKTAKSRSAGTYIIDPIHRDLWLAAAADD